MRAFHYTEHIERPREEVFAYMMDNNNASRWKNMVRQKEIAGGGPIQVGSKVLLTMDVWGKQMQIESEVCRYEPPHRVAQRNTREGVTGVFEYVLEPNGAGTDVAFTCDLTPHGFMWLLLPLLVRKSRARYRDQLGALKRAIVRKPVI